MDTNRNILSIFFAGVFALVLSMGCDNSIDFQEEREEDYYSIYGRLSITEVENFIRVQDNRIPLFDVTENDVDVVVTLENKSTGEIELLEKRIIKFEEVVTHNFFTRTQFTYNTEYQVFLDDGLGYQDSLDVITPRLASVSSEVPFAPCNSTNIVIDLVPLNLSVGEIIQYSVDFEWNERDFSNIFRAQTVNERDDELQLIYNLDTLIDNGFQVENNCFDVEITEFTFKYTIFGRELNETDRIVNEDGTIALPFFGKKIVGIYSGEHKFAVSDTAYDFDYWFPSQ